MAVEKFEKELCNTCEFLPLVSFGLQTWLVKAAEKQPSSVNTAQCHFTEKSYHSANMQIAVIYLEKVLKNYSKKE